MTDDLFGGPAPRKSTTAKGKPSATRGGPPGEADYTASSIEVLEGLEPVRRRPGMYIGGTDANAMHHLFAEVIDNAMDEAVAGHATFIEVVLEEGGWLASPITAGACPSTRIRNSQANLRSKSS